MDGAGKRVLVTGGGRGLGKAIVERLADSGWQVWAADVQWTDAASSRADKVLQMDVADEASVAAGFAELEAAGGVDALVNNAAIFPLAPWDTLEVETFRRTLDVNVVGTFLCARAAALSMRRHGRGGAIVNIASVTFFRGIPVGLAYTASKGGVVGLTRSFAKALGPIGVRINCVAPGLMDTEGVREAMPQGVDGSRLIQQDPDRQLAGVTQTAGVAEAVGFLLSPAAREITGQVLVTDGGTYFN